jgi:urocanate hydratase
VGVAESSPRLTTPGPPPSSLGAPRRCRTWLAEAALRCLENNLHPDVAEDPEHLIVYGGRGKAARDPASLAAIKATLVDLAADETLLVQSGKPVAVFPTHPFAPRVLIANSLLVPEWATWEEFWRLEAMGLTMYGQMTAGSWIYIGTQGIVQGTYQTFLALAAKRFGDTLTGRVVLTAGLGGMGGAQPLAVTMNGGVALCVEVDPARLRRRLDTGWLDEEADSLEDGLRRARAAADAGQAVSIGVVANAADAFPALLAAGAPVDVVTDQTSAHDPLYGYVPPGLSLDEAAALRAADPAEYVRRARAGMAVQCEAMAGFVDAGAEVFDYGNSLRAGAVDGGLDRERAFSYPGFVPAYLRPLFCEGMGPFRWVALSGDPADIAATDAAVRRAFPDDDGLQRWLRLASERVPFQGLPARICWLGYGQRDAAGLAFNDLVRRGDVGAPIVIGRDHLDSGSVASPYRETEAMADGSDAIADWPILNALLNVASGAAWVAVHHGGGVGMGRSIHSGAQVVADGTDDAALRLSLVLRNDPGTGVVRHADAGYPEAAAVARERGVRMPMLPGALDGKLPGASEGKLPGGDGP